MSKPAKKSSTARPAGAATPLRPATDGDGQKADRVSKAPAGNPKSEKADGSSKQARVIAMLQSPSGTTIAAVMKATGWQQHSVRGFLAGVVRKRLKLKLGSEKVDDTRVYRITSGVGDKSSRHQPKRRAS